MSEAITIGTVKFLNAWPLTAGLEDCPGVTLCPEAPGALAPLLKAGEVDVALAPAIEYFRLAADHGERARGGPAVRYVALPVAAIASRGEVGSVRLFGYTEAKDVRRVLLDPASRTSNALVRLVVTRRMGGQADFLFPRPDAKPGTTKADAELMIGDRALVADPPGTQWVVDLGEAWDEWVHLPFVYAFWVAREDAPIGRLVDLLSQARDRGLASLPAIAARGAETLGIPARQARVYLTRQVSYEFGPRARKGLQAFYRMVAQAGLAPQGVSLRMARPGAGKGA